MIGTPFYEIPPTGYGGIELICADLVDALVARGHRVTLFGAGQRSGTRATFVSTNPQLQHDRLGEVMPDLLHAARVNRLLEASGHRYDVVHDHSAAGPLMAAARPAPTVVTVHASSDGEFGDLYADLGTSVGLVAISDFQRRQRPGLNWVGTVHNGVDARRFELRHRPSGPVLWLARYSPDKGPDLAIQACRAAGLPLVLAGKCIQPEERCYLDNVVRPMVGPDVRVILNADRAATRDLLATARCLIMPIRWHEPFGMVMLEAMASGTPVVALRRGSVPEIVQHGVTGWICDDPEELPYWLRRSDELDSDACVEHVRRHFAPDLMAQRYENVYRKTIMSFGFGWDTDRTTADRTPFARPRADRPARR